MSTHTTITRHAAIIGKLRKRPASFKEIDSYLVQQGELTGERLTVSLKTFRRDLDSILSLYQVEIKFDRPNKVYRVINDSQPEASGRLLDAFNTFNAMSMADGLSQYIYFEDRRPAGTENLHGLLHAIKNKLLIKFDYQKYWDAEANQRVVECYALKEFNHRWYVIAVDFGDKHFKSFALDRLTNLEITKRVFVPRSHSINEIYKDCYGIMSPNASKTERVLLSFEPHQGKYIKSLPLHKSQQVVIDNDDELQIELKLYVTYDFVQQLLSHGRNVKVLRPESLKNTLQNVLKEALANYHN